MQPTGIEPIGHRRSSIHSTSTSSTSMLLFHLLLLVVSTCWSVSGQGDIPTVPCYGQDCSVTQSTTESTSIKSFLVVSLVFVMKSKAYTLALANVEKCYSRKNHFCSSFILCLINSRVIDNLYHNVDDDPINWNQETDGGIHLQIYCRWARLVHPWRNRRYHCPSYLL